MSSVDKSWHPFADDLGFNGHKDDGSEWESSESESESENTYSSSGKQHSTNHCSKETPNHSSENNWTGSTNIHQSSDKEKCCTTAAQLLLTKKIMKITLLVAALAALVFLTLLCGAYYFETTVLLFTKQIGLTVIGLTGMLVMVVIWIFFLWCCSKMVFSVFGDPGEPTTLPMSPKFF